MPKQNSTQQKLTTLRDTMRILERTARCVAAALMALSIACGGLEPPRSTASIEDLPRVSFDTALGRIIVEINTAAAPTTASNFLAYVDEGLFPSAHFYRVVTPDNQPHNDVKIEVIQGGLGFDADSPRAAIAHETTVATGLRHLDGTISMARLEPGTATSEFFITINDQPELDFGGARNPDGQGFAAFGRVIHGMDVVRAIQRLPAENQMLIETVAIANIERLP